MRPVKNKRRIDPRYFLDETADRDDLVAEEKVALRDLSDADVSMIAPNNPKAAAELQRRKGLDPSERKAEEKRRLLRVAGSEASPHDTLGRKV